MFKRCTQCGKFKQRSEFHNKVSSSDGFSSRCKLCNCKNAKQWQLNNHERAKTRKAEWYQKHKELTKQRAKTWGKVNPKARKQILKFSDKKRRSTLQYRISRSVGDGIWRALRSRKAGMTWETVVGYTLLDFMQHLESKFLPGMTWDNYGKWHIDHIVPRSFFCYSDFNDQEFQYCWSLDNLQPLWALDNLSKGAKLDLAM